MSDPGARLRQRLKQMRRHRMTKRQEEEEELAALLFLVTVLDDEDVSHICKFLHFEERNYF